MPFFHVLTTALPPPHQTIASPADEGHSAAIEETHHLVQCAARAAAPTPPQFALLLEQHSKVVDRV